MDLVRATRQGQGSMGTQATSGDRTPSATSLVRVIHAASVDSGKWPDVLEQLRQFLGARVVTLGYHEFSTGSDSALLESPTNAGFGQHIAAYSARNPWFLSSSDYVPGRVMTGEELISHSDLRRTDFYRGFLQPRGLLHRICGVIAQRERGAQLISAYRAEEQDAFGDQEKAELELLLEHVALSLESQWRWQEADDLARALLALTNHDANPVMLVGADSESIFRNQAAERFLELGVGLRLDGSRLVASSSADQRLLRETIARLARAEATDAPASPSVVTLGRAPSRPPVVVVVRAAGQVFTRQANARSGLAILTVRGGQSLHDPALCAFSVQYALTAAQAKVSSLILAGQPVSTVAQLLHVSENTVRSHLKQVFQKTDTHSQMDLVHLHARVCTTLS
jgi:DNA-binding CsgD family transcriptional regulator